MHVDQADKDIGYNRYYLHVHARIVMFSACLFVKAVRGAGMNQVVAVHVNRIGCVSVWMSHTHAHDTHTQIWGAVCKIIHKFFLYL